MKALIGEKIGMTRIFDEKGNVLPVTLVSVKDLVVSQVKTQEKDGSDNIQVAVLEAKKINKPLEGHLKASKTKTKVIKEFALEGDYKVGDKIDMSKFQVNDKVAVTAISKGKGFAGTVKRHHFHLGPKTHGSDNYRQPGSIGSMYPQRVIKGRKMAGHLGNKQATIKNLKVVQIDQENKIIMLKGAVPGANKSIVYIWSENA